MKKRVNIKINAPIYNVIPPITRTLMNVEMSTGDIRNCICAKATVEEILDSGKIIILNLYNYNKDNNPKKKVEPKKEEVKIQEQAKPKEAVNVKIQPKKEEQAVHPGPIQEKPVEQPKKPIGETKKEVKHEQKNQKLTPVVTVKKEEAKAPVEEQTKEEKK